MEALKTRGSRCLDRTQSGYPTLLTSAKASAAASHFVLGISVPLRLWIGGLWIGKPWQVNRQCLKTG